MNHSHPGCSELWWSLQNSHHRNNFRIDKYNEYDLSRQIKMCRILKLTKIGLDCVWCV